MCSICGMIDFKNRETLREDTALKMGKTMYRRGPDQSGIYSCDFAVFHHNRLSVMDPERGLQPMTAEWKGNKYTIVYNGEIYNSEDLRAVLRSHGVSFKTDCDTETVLYTYAVFGEKCPELLNGIFAFTVIDEKKKRVFVARDRFGVKPFFYAEIGSTVVVASEIKAILAHPDFTPSLDMEGLWQLLFLSPVTINGSGIFKGIKEIKPAECGYITENGTALHSYWRLRAEKWKGSAEEAAHITEDIFTDAVCRQLKSDVPLAVLLSGGLDSSVVTSVAAKSCRDIGQTLSTYSFEYEGNKEYFKASLFQPKGDDEFALYLADYLGTNHTVLTADNLTVAEKLFAAVDARDIPGQADIDSSLLYFCGEIKKKHTVVLSGECSDEIFGGYPWFYRPEMLYRDFFPWIHNPFARINLFRDEITRKQEGYEFISNIYKQTFNDCPVCDNESEEDITARRATFLSVNYFMMSLLERKDRMSMYSSLEVRVPFADHRLLEFVYNVPWSIKFENKTEKALLRNAMKAWLPDKILYRKKSPYPKTHSPVYEKAVRDMLSDILKRGGIIGEILNIKSLEALLSGDSVTWFGQLMATPQMLAWLIQFDYWCEKYKINFNL